MTTNDWLFIAISLLGIIALIGIYRTKTANFRRYLTCLLLLTFVLFLATLLLAAGKIEGSLFAKIAFAVAWFAGSFITGKYESVPNPAVHTDAAR